METSVRSREQTQGGARGLAAIAARRGWVGRPGFLLLALAAGAACQHASPRPIGESDEIVGDRLTHCAAAHTHNILILEQAHQDVSKLYAQVGYFQTAGAAFTSKQHADQKYGEARADLDRRMNEALAAAPAERTERARRFMEALGAELEECARYQRANKDAIDARVKASLPRDRT